MKPKLFILTLLTVLLLSACSAFATPADPLQGTSWELVSYAGQAVVPGTKVTLKFEDEQASGNAGCNSYGGNYQVNGDQVRFEQMISTMMACADQSVMDQESTYLQFLGNAQRFELADGWLQLFRSDGEALVFVPAR